ncbi:MAG TPA: OmpA family protein [Blastocatellia bacterium]|nr:OmpA family protein [Blastocatellia bacterium]
MRLRGLNEAEIDIWPAFTDFLTSVLFVVILFIFGILFSSIARSSSQIEVMQEKQRRVRKELEYRLRDKIELPPEDGNLQRVILRIDESGGGGVIFQRGSAQLSDDGKRLLGEIVEVLEENRDEYDTVQVEGHTDDVPVSGAHPSNWELSAARAGAVVNYILSGRTHPGNKQLEPWRFSANGRAEYRPYGVAESLMTLDSSQNPRRGPGIRYVVESNQVEGKSPVADNPRAQRNRRIEIILTYKVNRANKASSGN